MGDEDGERPLPLLPVSGTDSDCARYFADEYLSSCAYRLSELVRKLLDDVGRSSSSSYGHEIDIELNIARSFSFRLRRGT